MSICKCDREANSLYGGRHTCCVFCSRNGTHTVWCNKRQDVAQKEK